MCPVVAAASAGRAQVFATCWSFDLRRVLTETKTSRLVPRRVIGSYVGVQTLDKLSDGSKTSAFCDH